MTGKRNATFSWPLRVYYEDTDAGGVVYHAQYLKFFERARSEWLRASGIEQDTLAEEHGVVFAVIRAEVDYLRPARFNDELLVTVGPLAVRGSRIGFRQSVVRPDEESEPLALGMVEVACVDRLRFCGRRVPDFVLRKLKL